MSINFICLITLFLPIFLYYQFLHPSISVDRFALPSLFSYCQVTGQIRLLSKGSICFGLSENPISEFELVAEELLMSDSVIKVKCSLPSDSFVSFDGSPK